ncbi:MAG: hypothetical protein ACREWG_06825 [Gammaproteobacteria bacterium]
MQMSLPLPENPSLSPEIWEHLDEVQRAIVLDKLAQLIAKTVAAGLGQEESSYE